MEPTDPTPTPPPAKPSRAELVELALRYAYEHDRKGSFDFDTWHAACSLVLGDIGGHAIAVTTLKLQEALDSYRSGPTRDAEDADAQAKALWATLQSALIGGQSFADPEASRNYLAVTFVGMRSPLFDRAEVHFIRPGGLSPNQRAEAAVAQAQGLREQVRARDALLAQAQQAAEEGRAGVRAAREQIETLTRQHGRAATANGELAWLVADRIWAGELFKNEAAGELLAGEAPEEDEGPLTARERGFMAVVNELKERAKPARDALEAELTAFKAEFDALWEAAVDGREDDKSLDDTLRAVGDVFERRLKAIGAAP